MREGLRGGKKLAYINLNARVHVAGIAEVVEAGHAGHHRLPVTQVTLLATQAGDLLRPCPVPDSFSLIIIRR